MNEKVSKKIGEAYAFSVVLKSINEKTPQVLEELLGNLSTNINFVSESQISGLEEIINEAETVEIVKTKAEKTTKKITEMGDFYVGDDWDDSAEVLEWLSFFLGAAIIHWQLILGAGKELNNEKLIKVSESGVKYFEDLLEISKDTATKIGKERASQ